MSNDEAIKYLQQIYPHGGHSWLDEQRTEAIRMAIEALKEKPVSEDLGEATNNYVLHVRKGYPRVMDETDWYICNAFKAGANWHKEQMMAKAFDFTKEHNTACVLASECLRNHGWFNRERVFNDLFLHLSCVDELFEGKFSGKTKVIVIKED